MSNFLTEIGGESVLFSILESSIPKIKSFLIEELERHEKENNPSGRIMFNIIFKTADLLTINLVEKKYKMIGLDKKGVNYILSEMLTINRIIAPAFFVKMDEVQEKFKKEKELSLEIIKYEKDNKILLVVAFTEQDESGICESPIKVVSMDSFLSKIINSKKQ